MVQILRACAYYNSGDYTHLGFGALRRVNGLGLVKLRFHVTLGDAVTQRKTPFRVKYEFTDLTNWQENC